MSYLTNLLGTLAPAAYATWAAAVSDVGDGYLQPHAIGALGASETIDPNNGRVQTGTVDTAATTITFGTVPNGEIFVITLILTNSGAGHAVSVGNASYQWVDSAPTLDDTDTAENIWVAIGAGGVSSTFWRIDAAPLTDVP